MNKLWTTVYNNPTTESSPQAVHKLSTDLPTSSSTWSISDRDPWGDVDAWMRARMGWEWVTPPFATISLRRGLDIKCAVTYTEWTGASCLIHCVSDGTQPLRNRTGLNFLRFVFRYPFHQLKAERITAIVAAANSPMLRVATKLGFVEEARLVRYFPSGDGVLFRMLREECRWFR